MRKLISNTLVLLSLIGGLSACSKEEIDRKNSAKTTGNNGSMDFPADTGEYVADDGSILFAYANANYQDMTKPLDLDKYANGISLTSVCNKDLTLEFSARGHKYDKSTTQWGYKPNVVEEFAPVITFKSNAILSIKLSKKVIAFGIEYNTRYRGKNYNVTSHYWDQKLNKKVNQGFTSYLNYEDKPPVFGHPGGAYLYAIRSDVPFDQVKMIIGEDPGSEPVPGMHEHYISGIRYTLAD
jgi:hypothetical protein